ncbi:VOC family protein [Saccharothrix sp. Mg75]|uniref:VOC family protein n=1 Tax=Saccharothrix sp. Mg75 TaxID=3445357 RepID=UPI003EEDB05A
MATAPDRSGPLRPAGSNTLSPFVITDDAPGLVRFCTEVLGATEVPEARTLDGDGLVLHAELRVGDSVINIVDRKPDWPHTPAFTLLYVDDAEETVRRATERGARLVTRPTGFFGDTLARFLDPFGNLWWVWQHRPEAAPWGSGDVVDEGGDEDWTTAATPELEYVHASLLEAMTSLHDPRAATTR